MNHRDSLPLYLAYLVIFVTAMSISYLLWTMFQTPAMVSESVTTVAPLAFIPTALATTSTVNLKQAAPTTQPASASLVPQTHTIQSGETMFSIATSYNLTVAELAATNHIIDPSLIQIGQELVIPNQFVEPIPEITPSLELPTNPSEPVSNQNLSIPPTLNGIPLDQIVVMPPNVLENSRAIYAKGQALGRNSHTFSKVGDSTVENDHFLSRFDVGPYNLGDYAYLQHVIDHFPGSFNRDSAAVRIGLHAWTIFDPVWADKTVCQPNETVIACEFRLHNPSIVLIRLGANDVGAPSLYDESMRQVVQFSIDNGVIPIIGTKADRNEGSNQNNDIVRQISADFQIPLWEFDSVAGTLPGRGLDVDYVHMNTFYAHDYTDPTAFARGHSVHNLTALMVLDAMINEIILSAED